MAFAIVNSGAAHAKAGGTGAQTTPAISTIGADLILAFTARYNEDATPTDSVGITWTGLTQQTSGGNTRGRLWYAWVGSTGWGTNASHTFGINTSFDAIDVAAFSGALTGSDPFNAENGATGSGVTSLSPGSVSPFGTDLFIAGLGWYANNTMAIGSSFSITDQQNYAGGGSMGAALAWKESASSENPSWTWSGTNESAAVIASFKGAGGGGGATNWGPWVVGNNWNRLVQNVR